MEPELFVNYMTNTDWFALFHSQSLAVQIILAIVGILAIIGIFYLAVKIIEGVFWLVLQILKAVFLGLTLMFYSLITIFIILPIEMIANDKEFEDVFKDFEEKVEEIVLVFYPKSEKESKKRELKASIQVQSKKPSVAQAFHCSNCGAPFTVRMETLIKRNQNVYCEKCGQEFRLKNEIPEPLYN